MQDREECTARWEFQTTLVVRVNGLDNGSKETSISMHLRDSHERAGGVFGYVLSRGVNTFGQS